MKREQNQEKGSQKKDAQGNEQQNEGKRNKKQGKQVKTKERGTNDMKAEQKPRKQEQNGTGRQRKHEVDSKIEEALSVWMHEKTTLLECNVLKFSTFGRSPPSSVGRAPRWVLLLSQLRTQLCELTSTEHAPAEDCGHSRGGAAWGFPYPHETRTNTWKRLQRKFSESGVAQWLACWAHNPKVPESKPGSAMHVLSQAWPVLCATQSLLKLAPFLQSFLKGGTAPHQAKRSAKS